MSKEDQLVNWLIESHDGDGYEVEVPYNHYGDRGVVDLVLNDGEYTRHADMIRAIEVKSPEAVMKATGANEIIRQFKRQKKYFQKGSSYRPGKYKVSHHLVFVATPETRKHVENNRWMYSNVGKVLFRTVGETAPAHLLDGRVHHNQSEALADALGMGATV